MRIVFAFSLLLAVARAQLPGFGAVKFACSTAMICTKDEFCDAKGVISTSPVVLTEGQRLMSVPKLPCRLKEGGGDGVCCRDPNYKDDWPVDYVDPGLRRPKPPGTQNKDVDELRPKAPINEHELSEPLNPDRQYLPPKNAPLPKDAIRAGLPLARGANLLNSFFERRVAVSDRPVTTSVASQPATPASPIPVPQSVAAPAPVFHGAATLTSANVKMDQNVDAMIDVLKSLIEPYQAPLHQERHIVVETIGRRPIVAAASEKVASVVPHPRLLPQAAVPAVPNLPKLLGVGEQRRTTKYQNTLLTGCPRRNRTALPDKNTKYDDTDNESGAGEFPWQAAILDTQGKLLCGCYFTEEDTCVTSAACVSNVIPSDLKVAVGIYNITSPLTVLESPQSTKPAQILAVEAVEATDNVAVVFLRDPVQLNYYTLPICVDRQQGIAFSGYDDCVVTGWGANEDTTHWFDVELLAKDECERIAPGGHKSCARAHNPQQKNLCDLVEHGAGLQCRYLGDRSSRKNDIYWLKGVLQTCTADQTLIYDHLDIDWFETVLMNQRQKA